MNPSNRRTIGSSDDSNQVKSLATNGTHRWTDQSFKDFVADPTWLLNPDHVTDARQLMEDAIHDIVVTNGTLTITYRGGTSIVVNTPHCQRHSVELPASIAR